MCKTTLIRFANPIAFGLFILFFNATHAQEVVRKTELEKNTSRFLKSPIILTDLVNYDLTKGNDGLLLNKGCDAICSNEIVSIVTKDRDGLSTNLDNIMLMQYYKQFVVLYKNIS
jgi:hypothetical protein